MNLAKMIPHGELASSGYALANPAAANAEFLVYFPDGGNGWVNLTSSPGDHRYVWLRPETGQTYIGAAISGGKVQSFTPPFSGNAVLYIYQIQASQAIQGMNYKVTLPVIMNGYSNPASNMCLK